MKFKRLPLLCLLSLTACSTTELEQEVSLADVPQHILSAARQAVKGFVIESAEIETEDGIKNWELEGSANGKSYEIEISQSGEILEIEENP